METNPLAYLSLFFEITDQRVPVNEEYTIAPPILKMHKLRFETLDQVNNFINACIRRHFIELKSFHFNEDEYECTDCDYYHDSENYDFMFTTNKRAEGSIVGEIVLSTTTLQEDTVLHYVYERLVFAHKQALIYSK